MKVLTKSEIESVSGAGTLKRPVDNPKTPFGELANEIGQVAHDLGTFLGCTIYDWTHPRATR